MTGRIRKYLEEICLVSQAYVKDGDKTVGKLLEEKGAKMVGFTRLAVGEGIEKKEDDFAAEVAKMAADDSLRNKPREIVENMVEGRIRKHLEEICLVSQTYVKDGDKTVGKLLEENGAKMIGFTRLAVGEGIEKKEDDFAAEVAKMAGTKEPAT
ncbi:MAG: hypothetical protein SGARI_007554, partial [Bacillariaceae sp.]